MSVYFGVPLKRATTSDAKACLKYGDCEMLLLDDALKDEVFDDFCPGLTITYVTLGTPTLTLAQSDESYLVLPKYYYKNKNFDSDKILVPVNQYVKCWYLGRRIDVDEDRLCDVMVLAAHYSDMFYVVRPDAKLLYAERELLRKEIVVNTKLHGYLFGMEDILWSGQSEYLRADKLNYGYWRDV